MRTKLICLVVLASLAGLLLSCGTTSQFTPGKGNKYQYTYKLMYPVENSNLLFHDDSIIIQFKFDEAAIRFQLQNISNSYLAIDWNKTSMNIQGRYFPIRHVSNLYYDSSSSTSILLPPLGYLRDIVIPRDNIYNDGDRWIEVDLFPTIDRKSMKLQESIKKSAGRRIGLLLPMMFGSTEYNYEFDFQVDSVKRIPWKNYEPFQRIPEPPSSKHQVSGSDNVTTAIIAVGILGFSAYVLSVKKSPPSE
ncbi:MAG: hypothetical protein ABSA44_12105 [Bacteroidota bacterium]|jgi:hypothetical protein